MATNDGINNSLSGQTGSGQYVGDTSPTLVTPVIGAATGTSLNLGSSTTITGMIDDDTMATASATTAATSESIKAYVDNTVSSSGKILQVQQTVDVTNRSTSSTSFVTSSIAVTLTPASASNTVLVRVAGVAGNSNATAAATLFTLFRDSTELTPSGVSELSGVVTTSSQEIEAFAIEFEDSPATASSVTYTLYFKAGTATSYIGRRGVDTLFDTATVITAMEVGA